MVERNWKLQVEEFMGTMVATPNDPPETRTLQGEVFDYVAKFPLAEDFDNVVSTREEEITVYQCAYHDEDDKPCYAYFKVGPMVKYENF